LPSQSDFTKIKDNCTGLGIIAAWGLGGYVRENLINSTASDATYWSSTEYDVQGNNNAYDLGYYNNNVRVGNYLAKYYGHQVRCVKN
jgi:uncharacterized protein (TIGR02145 family)